MTNSSSSPCNWEEDELNNTIRRTAWVFNSLTGELTLCSTVEITLCVALGMTLGQQCSWKVLHPS